MSFEHGALARLAVRCLAGSVLTITLLEKITAASVEALRVDAADVFRFLGMSERGNVVIES